MIFHMQWPHAKAHICSHFAVLMSACLMLSYNYIQHAKNVTKWGRKYCSTVNMRMKPTTGFPIIAEQHTVQCSCTPNAERLITHRRDVTCPDVLLPFQSHSQLELQLLLVLVWVKKLLVTAFQLCLQILYLQEQQGECLNNLKMNNGKWFMF